MRATHTPVSVEVFRVFTLIADGFSLPRRETQAAHSNDQNARPAPTGRGGWLNRLENWAWRQRQRELDAHLAQSRDVFELEARIRDIERGNPSRYY
jgi:hypothetical protein